jgi:xanthine dehydrogenase YagR molybdenum-binding subunit
VLGWGMACASWGAFRMPCQVTVALNNDGTVRVSCATQDIGTGTYTIFAQAVSAKTGIPIDRIHVVLGDSALPAGPLSGGSGVTSSVLPAITHAVNAALQSMATIATNVPESPFQGMKAEEIVFSAGRLHLKSESPGKGIAFEEILKRANIRSARGEGKSISTDEDPTAQKYSLHSYGAQFVEVTWDPGIARLHVSRVVSVIDAGRIINLKPARNQVEGSVVMGVGMGIFEETHYDQKSGHPINNNFADYVVSTCADAPEIDVIFLDYPDLTLNEYGARGVGEIGLAGIAPAITAAVYHATGVRVRELPVKIENLL